MSENGCIPEFAFISKSGNGSDNWSEMWLTVSEKMTALKYIREGNEKYNFKVQMPYCASSGPFADVFEQMKTSCMVKANGDVMPCQNLYDTQFALCNINNFNYDEFINNLSCISNLAVQRKNTSYECEHCLKNSICNRGCLASAYITSGDVLSNDGDSEIRLKQYLKYMLRK